MKFTKKTIYIGLFSILYLIVAFSSFFHACAFFGLANNSWMSVILAFAFEVGQAAVLFSLLTSEKDRKRFMPWTLMFMFTLVQVIGNVYSSYKYIVINSVENLRYFKEPIFIWTKNLPDDQATVIIVYLVGALLPIAALLLTSMVTNYLSDQEALQNESDDSTKEIPETLNVDNENPLINQNSILTMENQGLQESLNNKDAELAKLKQELEELKKTKEDIVDEEEENDEVLLDSGSDDEIQHKEEDVEQSTTEEDENYDDISDEYIEEPDEQESDTGETEPEISETEEEMVDEPVEENIQKRESHFINL